MLVVAGKAVAVTGGGVSARRFAVASLTRSIDAGEGHRMVLSVAVETLPMHLIWRLRGDIGVADSATALNPHLLHGVGLMAD